MKGQKIKNGEKKEIPDTLHLTALVGADIGGNLLVASNKVFVVREDSVLLEI